ncbi:MAG: NUDIX domain-containing protein [Alphaproteobacteria bacterium]|nr:NUDIX domain-containing protein [Alphaproteobacteria bacterium]
MSGAPHREAAVILPRRDGRILMQLRDEKESIVFPGSWGYFGGTIEPGETPEQAARRELAEETGLDAAHLRPIGHFPRLRDEMPAIHAFGCELDRPAETIELREGMDFALVSVEDMRAGHLYSPNLGRSFPVVNEPFMMTLFAAGLTW